VLCLGQGLEPGQVGFIFPFENNLWHSLFKPALLGLNSGGQKSAYGGVSDLGGQLAGGKFQAVVDDNDLLHVEITSRKLDFP
jgi:hypothetical protein